MSELIEFMDDMRHHLLFIDKRVKNGLTYFELSFLKLVPMVVHSDATVEKGIFGTKRHYWVQPREKDR